LSIIVFSALITFLLTWVYKITINYPRYKEITDKQKTLTKEMKNVKDAAKLSKLQNEVMNLSMESFKMTLKPMIITFLPVLIIFALLREAYTSAAVGNIINWGADLPIVHTGGGWFFCYVLLSLVFNLIARKIFKF
jgi:uncharacterized membrane protein (DUF106 family)